MTDDIRIKVLKLDDRRPERVDLSDIWPEVGELHVSVMSGSDRDSYEWALKEAIDAKQPITALLLVRSITDAKGNRIFQDHDAAALGAKNWKALDRLWDVAKRKNHLSESEEKAIEKNSEAPVGSGL